MMTLVKIMVQVLITLAIIVCFKFTVEYKAYKHRQEVIQMQINEANKQYVRVWEI